MFFQVLVRFREGETLVANHGQWVGARVRLALATFERSFWWGTNCGLAEQSDHDQQGQRGLNWLHGTNLFRPMTIAFEFRVKQGSCALRLYIHWRLSSPHWLARVEQSKGFRGIRLLSVRSYISRISHPPWPWYKVECFGMCSTDWVSKYTKCYKANGRHLQVFLSRILFVY